VALISRTAAATSVLALLKPLTVASCCRAVAAISDAAESTLQT